MNRKGQFSIIAALLVAVVLIGTVITTYATLRYSTNQDQPQVLSSIDETNLALEKVLGFTVGYYGSVLQVTGDTAYAKALTTNYLNSSLHNVADIKPEWGSSFRLVSLDLSANWFTNNSYSAGQAMVDYDLTGLGISGMSYNTSCRLDVQVSTLLPSRQARLLVTEDGTEPVVNLDAQNFQFYRYQYSNLTWNFAAPSGELATYSNGTYLLGIPADIDPQSYVIQVTDMRGIIVAAASFSRITSTLMWNTTDVPPEADYVDINTTDMDSSPNKGTQSNFTAQQYGSDSVYDTLTEGTSEHVLPDYYPSSYFSGGSTTKVSGELSYLEFDDGVRMIFRSYASSTSAQTLYAHQETASIGGTPYYTFKAISGDSSGTTLTAPMSSSRALFGKAVYSLQGVSSIPASTWTANYRAWQGASPVVAFDSASSVETETPAAYVSWSHTTGVANNRLLLVSVSVHAETGTPTTVTGVTYGGVPLTQVTTALYSAESPQVRTYIFRLLNPQSGTRTVTVTFAASTLYVCGATTYTNVEQSTPIQNYATTTGSSTSPSVPVTVTGTGRAVFSHLAGHRTGEAASSPVTYVGAGDGSASSGLSYWPYTATYPTPAYPSGLQGNDLILLQVTVRDTTNTPTTPDGFTLLYGPDSTGTGRQWIYYKFATGTESGTITITIGGTNCKMARMYAFRNVATSDFYEGEGFRTGTGNTIYAQSVTTAGSDRLAVSFVFVNDNNDVGSFSGETGGDWTEATSEFTTGEGSDGCVQLQTATMPSAGTISGGSCSMNYDPWGVRAFALKPKTTASPQVTYVGAGDGSGTTGNPTPTYPSGLQADDLILLQVTVRDTYYTPTTPNGFTLLYGPDSTGTGRQWIYYKFATGSESGPLTVTIGGYSCKMARMYSFRNVALSNFTESGGFGSGSWSTINAESVTTDGTNRLAVSFVFVNDNNDVGSFSGETGGDWTEAVDEYQYSGPYYNDDGCIQLQTATMASAGTISGGSCYMGGNDPWGVRAFALKPKAASSSWVITEGSGQNNRWTEETNQYKGRGSDKLNVTAGPVTMSWSTDSAPNWVCSAVVINPFVPVGHCNIDVLIRKSDGTLRSTIATNVANSTNLASTATTLSGTYPWGAYTVVDQTDYLEIDYYVEVTITGSSNAYLRIDDQSLAPSSQTRISGVILPSEYTSEIEFIGTSNTESWSQLVWTTDANCTAAGVAVTTQLYNYVSGSYPTSGDGFKSAVIGTSDVTVTQTITSNPENFRNSITGEWKLKFKAVTASQFDLNLDLVEYSPVPNYVLDIEEQWASVDYAYPRQDLCIRTGALGSENLRVDVRVGSSWVTVINSLLANQWNNLSVTQYIDSSTFTIRFRDSNNSSDPTPDSWDIDAVLLNPQPDVDELLSSLGHTIVVELLQNGTMRWLGQNLQLTTQGKPLPPVPVKAIHVNQTINGVNQEVPFQVEDWSSEYRIPLGLTNNATVFSNRQMIVFLINVTVSKVTVWWDGSDQATQTPKAYTSTYFTGDNPDNSRLTNGKLALQFDSSFTVTSTVGSASNTANFMRINNEASSYGSGLAYVIHHGIVRDIVQQEAEWGTSGSGGGADGCPNVYANIVLTLPAQATYYTYQLRLMFIDSTQSRSITDLCPIRLSSTLSSPQIQTENGTVNGVPIVASGAGSFYDLPSAGWTAHHWSQFLAGSQGAGIMFTNASNQQLYAFDSIAGTSVGALRTNTSAKTIELLPVAQYSASFTNTLDVSWRGAVATFDNTAAPLYAMQGTAPTGLWLLVEYPPTVAVSSES
jgi:hypothetical protein